MKIRQYQYHAQGTPMKIRQHLPSFCEGFEVYQGEFETPAELLKLPFLARVDSMPDFYRLVVHRHYSDDDTHLLMAELEEGRVWYVLAWLQGPDLEALSGLPDWEPPPEGETGDLA
jgi:hypothetical protein